MEWLFDNWYLIVAFLCVGAVAGVYVYKFLKLPTDEKLVKFKEYLCELVLQAEKELGSSKGKQKLEMVYNGMIAKFPFITTFMSMETFEMLVNGALYETGIWLKTK